MPLGYLAIWVSSAASLAYGVVSSSSARHISACTAKKETRSCGSQGDSGHPYACPVCLESHQHKSGKSGH
eukprot:253055-Pelagomonas_calceolata.AAC.4